MGSFFKDRRCCYEALAREERWPTLLWISSYDERVIPTVMAEKQRISQLTALCVATPSSPWAARLLERGMNVEGVRDEVFRSLPELASLLLSADVSLETQSAIADLIASCGVAPSQQGSLVAQPSFFKDLLSSSSPFAQRAAAQLLCYTCTRSEQWDDDASASVTALLRDSEVMERVNALCLSGNAAPRQFALRLVSLAGGFPCTRDDVTQTERKVTMLCHTLPQFAAFSTCGFFYAFARFYLSSRHLPRFHRSLLSGLLCGAACVLGLPREGRRTISDSERREGWSHQLWWSTAAIVTTLSAATIRFSNTPILFPRWMGDVCWRFPFIPRLFPAAVGLPSASRSVVPYTLVPFVSISGIMQYRSSRRAGLPLYDQYWLVNKRAGLAER